MFERYTLMARRVIFFARYEASQFGAPAIEPEHLLLGLSREDKPLFARVLTDSRQSLESIRRRIEQYSSTKARIPTSVELPLAPESKVVLTCAHEESDRLGHRHIGTEHLRLGLLRVDHTIAAQTLFEHGLRLDSLRSVIAEETRSRRSDERSYARS